MAAAHSGSWQVVTGIGLMLIGAALQWANKAVLIGGKTLALNSDNVKLTCNYLFQ